VAENKQKKPAGKAESNESETLGPPVGAAATSSQRGKPATPVAVGGDALVDRILPHLRKIIVGVVAGAVVLAAVFGWRSWREREAQKATNELAEALDVLHRKVDEPKPAADDKAKPDDKTKPAPDETKSTGVTYPSPQARAEAAANALRQAGEVRGAARLLEGNLLLEAGKLADAEAVYRSGATGPSLEAVLSREGLGYVAEARADAAKEPAERQKLLEAALAAFRAVQPDDKGPRRDYALYHEARILTLLDQRAEARAALEKALAIAPKSDLEIDIQQRLAHLEATPAP